MLATIVVAIVSSEIFVRAMSSSLSIDVEHIETIPDVSARMASGTGFRILFLGNSLTRTDIDVDVFSASLEGVVALHIERVHPDDTLIADWYYILKTRFAGPDSAPDLLIVPFVRDQLRDRAIDVKKLGATSLSIHTLPEMLRFEASSADLRFQLVLAGMSASFGNADRVRNRILDLVVPSYREAAERLNLVRAVTDSPEAGRDVSYTRLVRFLELVRDREIQTVFVAVPLPESYPIDPFLYEHIERAGMNLIDAQDTEGVHVGMYPDGYHMDRQAAGIFSQSIALRLSPFVSDSR